MTQRQQFIQSCKALRVAGYATPDSRGAIEIEAPPNKVFSASGTHLLVSTFDTQWAGMKARSYNYLTEMMSLGLEPCTESNCESCADPFGTLTDTERIA